MQAGVPVSVPPLSSPLQLRHRPGCNWAMVLGTLKSSYAALKRSTAPHDVALAPTAGTPLPVYSVPTDCPALITLFSPSNGHHGPYLQVRRPRPRGQSIECCFLPSPVWGGHGHMYLLIASPRASRWGAGVPLSDNSPHTISDATSFLLPNRYCCILSPHLSNGPQTRCPGDNEGSFLPLDPRPAYLFPFLVPILENSIVQGCPT